MNREIKFRLWDGYKFYYFESIVELVKETMINKINLFSSASKTCIESVVDSEMRSLKRMVTQISTGLHDRDGKEVYEGDILLVSGIPYLTNTPPIKGIVKRKPGCFYIDLPGYSIIMHSAYNEDRVIIGNIYENPDLEVINES